MGREGPIVQVGSALGATMGRLVRADEGRLRLLVACGAAGGIAATFNAPLAGVFFAMELILMTFSAEAFGAAVLSSVTASVIGRAAFGDVAFLELPAFHVDHLGQYGLFAVLGVVAGAVGVGFSRILYAIEDACDWLWRGPEWLRPAAGGLVLGLLLLALPQMYGVGYPVLENATEGEYAVGFLLLLLVGKVLATSVTIGIGGSGGVFAPSLFMGAMLGAAYGAVLHQLLPNSAGAVGAYALVGMGAVFAGASRAPITAVVILFELTGEYSIILSMMLAIALATATGRLLLSRDTVYTLKLRRRGIDLEGPAQGAPLGRQPVGSVMEALPEPLCATTPLTEAADVLSLSGHGALPVLDTAGRYAGVVTTRAVAEALSEQPDGAPTTAGDLVHRPPVVEPDEPLVTALHSLADSVGSGMPVLDWTPNGACRWAGSATAAPCAPSTPRPERRPRSPYRPDRTRAPAGSRAGRRAGPDGGPGRTAGRAGGGAARGQVTAGPGAGPTAGPRAGRGGRAEPVPPVCPGTAARDRPGTAPPDRPGTAPRPRPARPAVPRGRPGRPSPAGRGHRRPWGAPAVRRPPG